MILFLSLATAPYIAESIDMGLRLIFETIFGDVGCLSELFEYLVPIFLGVGITVLWTICVYLPGVRGWIHY